MLHILWGSSAHSSSRSAFPLLSTGGEGQDETGRHLLGFLQLATLPREQGQYGVQSTLPER